MLEWGTRRGGRGNTKTDEVVREPLNDVSSTVAVTTRRVDVAEKHHRHTNLEVEEMRREAGGCEAVEEFSRVQMLVIVIADSIHTWHRTPLTTTIEHAIDGLVQLIDVGVAWREDGAL